MKCAAFEEKSLLVQKTTRGTAADSFWYSAVPLAVNQLLQMFTGKQKTLEQRSATVSTLASLATSSIKSYR